MNIRITNKNASSYNDTGNYYDFPGNFILNDRTIDGQSNVEDIVFGDGGLQVGNSYLKSRTISIAGKYKSDSTNSVGDKVNDLISFIVNGQPCKMYVIGETVRKYLKGVYYNSITETDIIYDGYTNISLNLDIEYPKWISDTLNTDTQTGIASGSTYSITNNASWNVYPSIKITTASANATFRIKNTSDNNLSCKISDPTFTTGEYITVDSVAGSVKKGNVNVMQYLEGTFLKLVPGVNIFKYIGSASVDIVTTWRDEEVK